MWLRWYSTVLSDRNSSRAIRRVVSDFYDSVLDSDLLAHHFARIEMRELIKHQTAFIAHLTGGPGADYSDEVLARVHKDLGITDEEFEEMLVLLQDALEEHSLGDDDVAEVVGQFRSRRPVIVFGEGR